MTLWNANVFFELGIRVALDRPVALVKDSFTEGIPFDNSLVSCHTYDPRMEPWCLSVEVPKLRAFIKTAGQQEQNALWRYFGITQRASHKDFSNPRPDFPLLLNLTACHTGSKGEVPDLEFRTFGHDNAIYIETESSLDRGTIREIREAVRGHLPGVEIGFQYRTASTPFGSAIKAWGAVRLPQARAELAL